MGKVVKAKANSAARIQTKAKALKPTRQSSSSDEMPKAEAKKPKKGRTEKKKKDPNAPKRGLSAYMFYANDNRERVRNENPNITFGQVGKVLGEEWKALDDKQKTKYQKMAEDDKERYEREKAKYNAGDDEESD